MNKNTKNLFNKTEIIKLIILILIINIKKKNKINRVQKQNNNKINSSKIIVAMRKEKSYKNQMIKQFQILKIFNVLLKLK